MKRTLIIVSVLVLLLGGGAVYWYAQQKPALQSDPVDAIPVSASVIIAYPDVSAAWAGFQEHEYGSALSNINELALFFSRIERLDSLMRLDPELKVMFAGSTIWSSYHGGGADSLEIFHVIKANQRTDSQIANAWKKSFGEAATFSEQKVGEVDVYRVFTEEPNAGPYFAAANGLLLSSSTLDLLKAALEQLQTGESLQKDPNFANALNTAGENVEANLFVNYAKLPEYLGGILKPGTSTLGTTMTGFAAWSEFDVNLKDDGFTLNGFTYVNDSTSQFLSLFLNQRPQPIGFPEYLPANAASFVFFGIDDVIELSSQYRNHLSETGELAQKEAVLDSLNQVYGVDFEQNLLAWLGNAFGMCVTRPSVQSFGENGYLVMQARSEDLALKLLTDLSETVAEKNGVEAKTEELNGVAILEIPLRGALNGLFGESLHEYENPCFTVYNGYVIFGTSMEAVAEYLQYLQADRTLAKDLSFARFAENLGSTFNMFTYDHIRSSRKIFESYLNQQAMGVFTRNEKTINQFEAIGTQFSTTGNSFYSNTFIKYNPNSAEQKESQWVAEMDAKPIMPPVFVKNHISGEAEVLTQDENNDLYLFNALGQRLFKANIKEAVKSRPVQVDAFKNGKLQYLFNTKNFIYLIDRDGNLVDGYPVELPSEAETDLAVFDYDKDKDYRMLITCKNNHIYNYDIKGKKVGGWHHNKASDPTIHPFKHMLVSGKDYIVTGESNGKIHLLDRRGKNRVAVEKRVTSSKNNHLQLFKSSEGAFTGVYITDENGKIHRVALDGDIQPMDLGKYSPDHYFLVADLEKDGGPEFVFYDLNLLQVFGYKKEKVFEQRIEPGASRPILYDLGEQIGIGFYFPESQQLVLFDATGKMVNGFPLSGYSDFSVQKTDNGLLVVSAGNGNSLLIQTVR